MKTLKRVVFYLLIICMKIFDNAKKKIDEKTQSEKELLDKDKEKEVKKGISSAKKQTMVNNLILAKTPTANGGQ